MVFGIRAGDRRPRRHCPGRRFSPRAGPFHGEPLPSPFEWEAAAVRERIIREEVERRLMEEEVRRELALARARFHGGFGSVPFVGPGGAIVPPPPPGPFFRPDGPFTPPMPVGMHPNWTSPALLVSWEGFGPRRHAEFEQPMLLNERPLPPPKLQPRHIVPSESTEVFPSETKASDVIPATTEPTEPAKLQYAAKDWSCALCQVSATSEAGLSQHLEGKKHKAKLVQCGAIKVTHTNRSGLQASPSDAPKEIRILVDGELHQVVQKSNYIWCERCRVRCTNNAAMADHLRGKKHSLLNKVWRQIKAVRMNKEVKEDSAATCERKATEDGPTGIREEHEEDTYMTNEFSGDGSLEIPMEMKEPTDMAEEIDANGHNAIPVGIKKEYSDTGSKVSRNYAAETNQEGTDVDVVMDANKNFLLKVHQKSRNKASKNFLSKVHWKSRKQANKKFLFKVHQKSFLFKVHQKSRKKANKKFLFKVHQKSKKWLRIREVNENSSVEIPSE